MLPVLVTKLFYILLPYLLYKLTTCNFSFIFVFSIVCLCVCIGSILVGAKPQEVFSLSKNETSAVGGRRPAVGGRRSGGADHFGRPALEGQLSEVDGRLSAVGTFSKLFFINDFLNKKFFRRFAPDLEGGISLVISLDVAPQSTAAV